MAEPTLKIIRVTQDPADPHGFVIHFNRTFTFYERSTVPGLIADNFGPTDLTGSDAVTLRLAHKQFFLDPSLQARLKGIVAEAEQVAQAQLIVEHTAEGQATAQAEETKRELDAIDWDS